MNLTGKREKKSMSTYFRISFIIPAKNEESRIGTCLSSIALAMTPADNYEMLVIDNGSSDATVDIAEKHGAKVLVLPQVNISTLRNYGALNAGGDLLVFIDADVQIDSDFVANAAKYLIDKNVAVVTGKIGIPDECTWVEKTWSLNRLTGDIVSPVKWSSSMNMVIRKDVFVAIDGFSEKMETCEDVELSLRIIKKGYLILYASDVRVVHHGEAKTLARLFAKERWRGKSALKLMSTQPSNLFRLLSFLQIPFFIIASGLFVLSVISADINLMYYSSVLVILLPAIRVITVSYKIKSILFIMQIFVIWVVYYSARSTALLYELSDLLNEKIRVRVG